MFNQRCLILFSLVISPNLGFSDLPNNVVACSRSDPNFNSCVIKHGRETLPHIIKGDPKHYIPNFTPLKIKYVSLQTSPTIKLYVNNTEIRGLDHMELTDMNWDLQNRIIDLRLFSPELQISGMYHMEGQILIMNLKGNGFMNNSHKDFSVKVNIKYDLISRNSKEYMKITTVKSEENIKSTHFQFEKLLNNEQLSEQINTFLNENWKILIEELLPSISAIIETIIRSILEPNVERIPFDNIIKP